MRKCFKRIGVKLRNGAYFGMREVEVMSLVLDMVNLNCLWKFNMETSSMHLEGGVNNCEIAFL